MTIINLRHKTTAIQALRIAVSRQFICEGRTPRHYDAGMNFLGDLGQVPNHHLDQKNVTLICTWAGAVSAPMPWEILSGRRPNVMCDYNGSGNHFQNNDPRYLLPMGSTGLLVNRIEYTEESCMTDAWLDLRGYRYFRQLRTWYAKNAIMALNAECAAGSVVLSVC